MQQYHCETGSLTGTKHVDQTLENSLASWIRKYLPSNNWTGYWCVEMAKVQLLVKLIKRSAYLNLSKYY